MPLYSFENTETGDQFDERMPYDDLEKYLKDNPHLRQIFQVNVVDSVSIGVTQPPRDFQKYVLNKVKEVPGAQKSQIEKRWSIPKEA